MMAHAPAASVLDAAGNVAGAAGEIVILTAYMFNNVRLLLLSQMGRPYDPETGTGVVGKNYCYQVGGGALASSKGDVSPLHGLGRQWLLHGRFQRRQLRSLRALALSAEG